MFSIIVFGGWFGSGNLGDDAILIGLGRVLALSQSKVKLTAISTDPEYTKKVCNVEAIKLRSPRSLIRIFTDRKQGSYLDAFIEADGCIVSGGTPFYDYDYLSRMIHLGLPQLLSKKIICFGIGSKPIISRRGIILTRALLRRVGLISTRDQNTAQILRALGIKTPLRVTGDSALFMEPSDAGHALKILEDGGVDTSKKMIAVCPRKLSLEYRAQYHDPLTIGEINYLRQVLSKTADKLVERGCEIVFIPMHRRTPDDDLLEIEMIRRLMKNHCSKVLKRELKPQEAQAVLGRMSMVIGLRLHSLIFAGSQGVPIIGFDYDAKIRGFMELVGVKEFLCNKNSKLERVYKILEKAFAEEEETKRRLLDSCKNIRVQILQEAENVLKFIES